jgi:preprotein translocase subunit SecA
MTNRVFSLEALDHYWNVHLRNMDHLRDGIGLRGYGQKNPLHEYQREGFILFGQMVEQMQEAMKDPKFQEMMNDPEMMEKMKNMMGGGNPTVDEVD